MPVTATTLEPVAMPQHLHEHGYGGERETITFVKPFTFTHPDHQREVFPARTMEVPAEVANHWFARAHTDTPMASIPSPGTPAYAEARRAELMAATSRTFDQQQMDMANAASVNRKAIEETVRMEATDKIRAELMVKMQADFDAKLADAVAQTKADLTTPAAPDASTTTVDNGKKNGK